MSISHWPCSERPRERLLREGPEVLSDSELLAILLRNGVRGKDAVALSRDLLTQAGGLRRLLSLERPRLAGISGLGPAKIAALLSAVEIGRRCLREQIIGKPVLQDPETVFQYLTSSLRDAKTEIFKVVFLDKKHAVLDEADLARGTVDTVSVYPREILKAALERHAAALILAHNHPSGNIQPSPEDQSLTSRLEEACRSVSIDLLDHIIVGGNDYFSFFEKGLIGDNRAAIT